jgi:hypothetical protein
MKAETRFWIPAFAGMSGLARRFTVPAECQKLRRFGRERW